MRARHFVRAALTALATGALHGGAAAAPLPPSWPAWVDLSRWTDLDEDYRHQFALCDADNRFRGIQLPKTFGRRTFRGCSTDPNRVTAFRRLRPSQAIPGGAVAFTSKLSVDLDGSWFACNTPGRTDQCPTSLMLRDRNGRPTPVSSDHVPYVVMPTTGPDAALGKEFAQRTGVKMGDFGLVLTAAGPIPVIVADGGPFSKLGEGSIALHRRLGRELCATKDDQGRCRTMIPRIGSHPGPLVTILFPGTRRADITPANIGAQTETEGARLWQIVRSSLSRETR